MSQYMPIVRNILKIGHPWLRVPARKVLNPHEPDVQNAIADMMYTVEANGRVGVHAAQVGLGDMSTEKYAPYDMFVFRVPEAKDLHPRYSDLPKGPALPLEAYINPVITPISDKQILFSQVCASLKLGIEGRSEQYGVKGEVWIHEAIRIRYLDQYGNVKFRDLDGFAGLVAQHEAKHGKGRLFTDFVKDGVNGLRHESSAIPLLELLKIDPDGFDANALKELFATAGTRAADVVPIHGDGYWVVGEVAYLQDWVGA